MKTFLFAALATLTLTTTSFAECDMANKVGCFPLTSDEAKLFEGMIQN